MRLRPLAEKDAQLMLEWMHDESVVAHLAGRFAEKTLDDCLGFIAASQDQSSDLHLAVADQDDTYMGTVSLKHIDRTNHTAEFAITVRKSAMGKGFSQYAMARMLELGLRELDLTQIFWCVAHVNQRAVRFYDKCGYQRCHQVPQDIQANYTPEQLERFIWYVYRG